MAQGGKGWSGAGRCGIERGGVGQTLEIKSGERFEGVASPYMDTMNIDINNFDTGIYFYLTIDYLYTTKSAIGFWYRGHPHINK